MKRKEELRKSDDHETMISYIGSYVNHPSESWFNFFHQVIDDSDQSDIKIWEELWDEQCELEEKIKKKYIKQSKNLDVILQQLVDHEVVADVFTDIVLEEWMHESDNEDWNIHLLNEDDIRDRIKEKIIYKK